MALSIAALLLAFSLTPPVPHQDKPPFTSCAWWQSLRADPSNELYLIGFAQGLVIGVHAYPLPDTPMDAHRELFAVYQRGMEQLLRRPSDVDNYINARCAEPRNAAVRMHGLVMLATFEKGGMPADRLESALQLFRQDMAPKNMAVLKVLSGK